MSEEDTLSGHQPEEVDIPAIPAIEEPTEPPESPKAAHADDSQPQIEELKDSVSELRAMLMRLVEHYDSSTKDVEQDMRLKRVQEQIEILEKKCRNITDPDIDPVPARYIWIGADDGTNVIERAVNTATFAPMTQGRTVASTDIYTLETGQKFYYDVLDYNNGSQVMRRVEVAGGGGSFLSWMKINTAANTDGIAICNKLDFDGDTIEGDLKVKTFHQSVGDTLYAMLADPRTDALWEDDPDTAVYYIEVITAGNRDGYKTYPGARDSAVTVGVTAIGDGTESADTLTWSIEDDAPLDLFMQARTEYDDAGAQVLYGVARLVKRDSNALMYEVLEETPYVVDTPEDCGDQPAPSFGF